jgi:hypothetical protein
MVQGNRKCVQMRKSAPRAMERTKIILIPSPCPWKYVELAMSTCRCYVLRHAAEATNAVRRAHRGTLASSRGGVCTSPHITQSNFVASTPSRCCCEPAHCQLTAALVCELRQVKVFGITRYRSADNSAAQKSSEDVIRAIPSAPSDLNCRITPSRSVGVTGIDGDCAQVHCRFGAVLR